MTYQFNDRGIITSPGKFEGEPEYTLAFWDHIDEADEIDGPEYALEYRFNLTNDDRLVYPALGHDALVLVLWEDGQGFVHHYIVRDRTEETLAYLASRSDQ